MAHTAWPRIHGNFLLMNSSGFAWAEMPEYADNSTVDISKTVSKLSHGMTSKVGMRSD